MRSCTPGTADNASDAPAALRRHENFVRHHADGLWRFFNVATRDAALAEALVADCFQDILPSGDEHILVAALYDRGWQKITPGFADAPLVKTLQSLPAPQRSALLLQEYAGLSPVEIADALTLPQADVERLLAEGRRKIQSLLA